MWNILITLFSIGYGDVYTRTYFGRIIITLLAFFGGFIISIITIAIVGELEMSKFETNAFKMIDFLKLKLRIRKLTKKMVFFKAKFFAAKRRANRQAENFNQEMFYYYKNKFKNAVQVRFYLKVGEMGWSKLIDAFIKDLSQWIDLLSRYIFSSHSGMMETCLPCLFLSLGSFFYPIYIPFHHFIFLDCFID